MTKIPPHLRPLENGDHLKSDEFMRRYDAMPNLKKAELINGVVFMPSPVRSDRHADPHSDLVTLFGVYRAATPGTRCGADGTVRLDDDNVPQPDVNLRILPTHGGQARVDGDGYIAGAPELVAEVA